jgi:transcriptional regulator GlxA family with amidase domain
LKLEIIIFDGIQDLDVFGVLDPLRTAGLDVTLKSLRDASSVVTISGAKVIPAGTFSLTNAPDVLIVPGGGWLTRAQIGAWAEAARGDILKVLKSYHGPGRVLASVCTGALLIAKAGLLADRPATTNRGAVAELKQLGVRVLPARVVDDGDIITASGVTASLDLGLWLVQKYCGIDKALEVSGALEFELRGPIWQRS